MNGFRFVAPLLLVMIGAFNAPILYMLALGFWSKTGGFTTAHYGRPSQGQHAIQIEINRALYMDEASCARKPDELASLQQLLKELVVRLGQLSLA